jgi:hypothetical protein
LQFVYPNVIGFATTGIYYLRNRPLRLAVLERIRTAFDLG